MPNSELLEARSFPQIEERVLSLLGRDMFGLAEDITEGRIGEHEEATDLAFTILHSTESQKRILLQEIGDTYHDMPWVEFRRVIDSNGFEVLFTRRFLYQPPGSPHTVQPEMLVAAHRERKLLLIASSANASLDSPERINQAMVYGAVDKPDATPSDYQIDLSACYVDILKKPDKPYQFEFNGHEALMTRLNTIQRKGFAFVNWNDPERMLDLTDYGEDQKIGGNLEEGEMRRKKEFFDVAPEWVQDFIV